MLRGCNGTPSLFLLLPTQHTQPHRCQAKQTLEWLCALTLKDGSTRDQILKMSELVTLAGRVWPLDSSLDSKLQDIGTRLAASGSEEMFKALVKILEDCEEKDITDPAPYDALTKTVEAQQSVKYQGASCDRVLLFLNKVCGKMLRALCVPDTAAIALVKTRITQLGTLLDKVHEDRRPQMISTCSCLRKYADLLHLAEQHCLPCMRPAEMREGEQDPVITDRIDSEKEEEEEDGHEEKGEAEKKAPPTIDELTAIHHAACSLEIEMKKLAEGYLFKAFYLSVVKVAKADVRLHSMLQISQVKHGAQELLTKAKRFACGHCNPDKAEQMWDHGFEAANWAEFQAHAASTLLALDKEDVCKCHMMLKAAWLDTRCLSDTFQLGSEWQGAKTYVDAVQKIMWLIDLMMLYASKKTLQDLRKETRAIMDDIKQSSLEVKLPSHLSNRMKQALKCQAV